MKLGPFTIARTKTLELQQKQSGAWLPIGSGNRWLLPWIQETSAGGWQRNEDVSISTALRNPTLFACVISIAQDIGKLRPMLVEQDDDGIWHEIGSESPFLPVLERPNSYQTWPEYAEWYITSKLLAGNVYVLKQRDQRGVVRALYVLDPYRVMPLEAPDGSLFYQLSPDTLAQVENSVIVPAREIIHDKMVPFFHPLVGVSPIYAAGFPASLGLTIRDLQNKFLTNGARPGGILMYPGTLKQEEADRFKSEWKTSFGGDNQGDIALLTAQMSYLPLPMMTAEQSQIIELAHMTDEDIAKCFRMPRHKVGIGPDPTYTNIQAKNQDYLNDCLQPHINLFQEKHTKGLELDNVPGKTLRIELDLDDLLLMDMAAKADAAQKAVMAGLSFNEARLRFWDEGPVVGGNSPLAQQQLFSLEALARRESAPSPEPTPALPPVPEEKNYGALRLMVKQKRLELAA